MPRGSGKKWDQIGDAVKVTSSSPRCREIMTDLLRRMFPEHEIRMQDPSLLAKASLWIASEYRKGSEWLSDSSIRTWSGDKLMELMQASIRMNDGRFEFPLAPEDEVHVADLEGGWTVVRIATREAAYRECNAFGATPSIDGEFADDDLEAGKQALWVIRDANGDPQAMIGLNRIAVCDVVGWRREPLSRSFLDDVIMPLVEDQGLLLMKPDSIPGKVRDIEGVIHDLHDLPEGVVIDGDLSIRDRCPTLERLPDGMTITGDLVIWRNANIERLPRDLVVGGGLGMAECMALRTIGAGLQVGGYSSFNGSRGLVEIEPGCAFGKGVDFPDRRELMSQKFASGGPVRFGDKSMDAATFRIAGGRGERVLQTVAIAKGVVEVVKAFAGPRRPGLLPPGHREAVEAQVQARKDRMVAFQHSMDEIIADRQQSGPALR